MIVPNPGSRRLSGRATRFVATRLNLATLFDSTMTTSMLSRPGKINT